LGQNRGLSPKIRDTSSPQSTAGHKFFLFLNKKGQLNEWKLTNSTASVTERDVTGQGQRVTLTGRMAPYPLYN